MKTARHSAFTLLELLIGVVISSLIAALALPAISACRDAARCQVVRTDFARFDTAIRDYKALHNNLPSRLADLDVPDVPRNAAGEYLDPWGSPYRYASRYFAGNRMDAGSRRIVPGNYYTVGGVRPRHVACQITSAGPNRTFAAYGEWGADDDLANFAQ